MSLLCDREWRLKHTPDDGDLVTLLYVPALECAVAHPRRLQDTDATTLWNTLSNGFRWLSDVPLDGKRYRFHEYGWRLPWLSIPLPRR